MRNLIHEGFDQNLSLEVLASHARLNKFYALRLFKRETGLTPHEYQRRIRVGNAICMLRKGRAIVEVAHAMGFCDQSHLTRAIRQVTFLTPGQYVVAARRSGLVEDGFTDQLLHVLAGRPVSERPIVSDSVTRSEGAKPA